MGTTKSFALAVTLIGASITAAWPAEDQLSSADITEIEAAVSGQVGLNKLNWLIDTRTSTGEDSVQRTCGLASVSSPDGRNYDPLMFFFAKYPSGDASAVIGAGGISPAQLKGMCRKFGIGF